MVPAQGQNFRNGIKINIFILMDMKIEEGTENWTILRLLV